MSKPVATDVRVILVGPSSSGDDRRLFRIAGMDAGVVIVPVSPIVQGIGRLAGDVLEALGKDSHIAPHGRTEEVETAWAGDWLRGHRIGRVVFAYVDDLDLDLQIAAAQLCRKAGAQPWFVCRTAMGALHAAGALEVPITELDAGQLLATAMETTHRDPEPASPPRPLDAQVALPPKDADRSEAIGVIRAVFEDRGSSTAIERVTEAASRLAPQWELAATNDARLERPFASLPLKTRRPFVWSDLRRMRDTAQVAACALTAIEFSVTEMLALRPSNLAADLSSVAVAGDKLPVPNSLREYLRARIATVRRLGPGADPLLLADRDQPMTAHHLRTVITAGFSEVGVIAPRLEVEYRIDPAERWLRRHGLALTRFHRPVAKLERFTRPGRKTPSCTYRTRHKRWER